MVRLYFLVIIFACVIGTSSCSTNDEIKTSNESFLIFGHFYGECLGEECVEIFKLEDERLFEDTNDLYPNQDNFYSASFVEIGEDKYQLVSDLMDYFPDDLLHETKVVYGCPDCADQGGLYLEYKSGEMHKYWIFDQFKADVPENFHEFMDKVNEKIDLINE